MGSTSTGIPLHPTNIKLQAQLGCPSSFLVFPGRLVANLKALTEMYFSTAFILATLPFLTAAVPLIDSPSSLGVAVPINRRGGLNNGVADTSRLQNGIRRSVAKFKRGLIAYERNTGVAHPLSGCFNSLNGSDTGDVPLTDDNEQLWYGTISVGSQGDNFTVAFDTTSSDLFLPSVDCGSSCSEHKAYDPSASANSQDLGVPFEIHLANGASVSGEQYSDVVQIAGLTANNQTLGLATNYSTNLQSSQFAADGLMGLAFESISAYNATPVFQTLISQDVLTSPVFGLKLATSGSELFLGGTNDTLFTGNFTWVPLTNQGFWQAPFNSISVNGQSVLGETEAIFVTISRQIIGDSDSITALFNQIDGAESAGNGTYTIPCSFNTSIAIDIGGTSFDISPSSFNLGPVSEGSSDCVAGAASDSSQTGTFWILGDVFLQNVYSAWDVGNSRIGFATLA